MKLFRRNRKAEYPESLEPPKNARIASAKARGAGSLREAGDSAHEGVGDDGSGASQGRFGPRVRALGRILAWGIFIGGLVTGSITLGRAFEEFVRSSPSFAIKVVEIEGNAQLSDQEILDASGIAIGDNIFHSKGEEIEARLRRHPALRAVSVERVLPSRFIIRVEEYRPIAIVALKELYLLSREGVAYQPLESTDGNDLPIISVEDAELFIRDRALRQRLLFEAASIVDAIERESGELLDELMEIHIRSDQRFVLRFFEERTDVFLGRGDYPTKLARLREILAELADRSLRASRVHLDNELRPERVTVRLKLSEEHR